MFRGETLWWWDAAASGRRQQKVSGKWTTLLLFNSWWDKARAPQRRLSTRRRSDELHWRRSAQLSDQPPAGTHAVKTNLFIFTWICDSAVNGIKCWFERENVKRHADGSESAPYQKVVGATSAWGAFNVCPENIRRPQTDTKRPQGDLIMKLLLSFMFIISIVATSNYNKCHCYYYTLEQILCESFVQRKQWTNTQVQSLKLVFYRPKLITSISNSVFLQMFFIFPQNILKPNMKKGSEVDKIPSNIVITWFTSSSVCPNDCSFILKVVTGSVCPLCSE